MRSVSGFWLINTLLMISGCSTHPESSSAAHSSVRNIAETAKLPRFSTDEQHELQATLSPKLSSSGNLSLDLSAQSSMGSVETRYHQRARLKKDSDNGELQQNYVMVQTPIGLNIQAGLFRADRQCKDEEVDLYAATRNLLGQEEIHSSDFYLYLPGYDSSRKTTEQLRLSQQFGSWQAELSTAERQLPGKHGGQQDTLRSHVAWQQDGWLIRLGLEQGVDGQRLDGNDLTISYQMPLARITASANFLDSPTLSSESYAVTAQDGPWSLGYLYSQNQEQRQLASMYAAYQVPWFLDIQRMKMTLELQRAEGKGELATHLDHSTYYQMKLDYRF